LYSSGDRLCSFCKYEYFANGLGWEVRALPLLKGLLGLAGIGGVYVVGTYVGRN
jgi:hypothetical protein